MTGLQVSTKKRGVMVINIYQTYLVTGVRIRIKISINSTVMEILQSRYIRNIDQYVQNVSQLRYYPAIAVQNDIILVPGLLLKFRIILYALS